MCGRSEAPWTGANNIEALPSHRENWKAQLNRNKMRATMLEIKKTEVAKHPTLVAYVEPYDAMYTEAYSLITRHGYNLYYDERQWHIM